MNRVQTAMLVGLLAGAAAAAPPELVDKGPVVAPLREPTFFSVKADPKKKLQLAKTFDTKAFSVVRLWSDDPATYDFQVFPKRNGTLYVGFFQDGETPLVVEVKAGTGVDPVDPVKPDPVDPVKPDPDKPKAARVAVVVVEEGSQRTVQQGRTLADKTFRQWLKAGGHALEVVEASDPVVKANNYGDWLSGIGTPGVLVFDADATGPAKPLAAFKLPDAPADWQAKVKEVLK